MTTRDHNKLIGLLFLIWGGIQIVGIVVAILSMLFVGTGALLGARARDVAPMIAVFTFITFGLIFAAVFAIPSIVAGLKMRKEKTNAKVWAIVAAILALFSVPLGTALGIYALWFLFGEHGKSFYQGGNQTGFTPPAPNSWQ